MTYLYKTKIKRGAYAGAVIVGIWEDTRLGGEGIDPAQYHSFPLTKRLRKQHENDGYMETEILDSGPTHKMQERLSEMSSELKKEYGCYLILDPSDFKLQEDEDSKGAKMGEKFVSGYRSEHPQTNFMHYYDKIRKFRSANEAKVSASVQQDFLLYVWYEAVFHHNEAIKAAVLLTWIEAGFSTKLRLLGVYSYATMETLVTTYAYMLRHNISIVYRSSRNKKKITPQKAPSVMAELFDINDKDGRKFAETMAKKICG